MLPALFPQPCSNAINALRPVQRLLLSSHVRAFVRSWSVSVPTCRSNRCLCCWNRQDITTVLWCNISKSLIFPCTSCRDCKRPPGILKTDKRDALSLANHLFNQLERGIQLADKTHLVRCLLTPTETAPQLQGWMRHRYELV